MQDYSIIRACDLKDLEDKVNNALRLDYQVHGNIFTLPSGYAQAVIREMTQDEADKIKRDMVNKIGQADD